MRRGYAITCGLLLLTFAVFVKTLGHEFILWDDDKNIYDNPYLKGRTLEYVPVFWHDIFLGMFIPVTYTVWALIACISGLEINEFASQDPIISPVLFHLANVVLHTASVLMVVLLLFRLLGRRNLFAAALGASLFALHPLQVEPVAWATGLKDVLGTFLALVSMCFYVRLPELFKELRNTQAWIYYACSLVFYLLALMSKPTIVVVPAMLALIDVSLLQVSWKKSLARLVPYFAAAGVFIVLTASSQAGGDEIFPLEPYPAWQRPLVALDALAFYLSKLFYPFQLCSEYGRTPSVALSHVRQSPFWVLPLAVFFLILCIRNHRRYYLAGFGLALLAVLPVLGLIPFGFQGQSTVADRYMYFSMVGLGLALAAWITFSPAKWPRWAAIAIIPVLAWLSYSQVSFWQNGATLFSHTVKVNPDSVSANYNLGLSFSHAGRKIRAFECYEKTLKLKSDFASPWNNIGFIFNTQKRYELAIPYLKKAIEVEPDYPGSYSNLGIAYDNTGRHEEAIAIYRTALGINPRAADIVINLAVALTNLHRNDEAIEQFERAAYLQPSWHQPYIGIGGIRMDEKNYPAAAEAYKRLIRLRPTSDAYSQLAVALGRSGEFPKCCEAALQAIEIAKQEPGFTPEAMRELEAILDRCRAGIAP